MTEVQRRYLLNAVSEESRIILDLIWPDGCYPLIGSLRKCARRKNLTLDEYLLCRFNSPNPTNNVGRKGSPLSEEAKQHLSDLWKGKKKSEEHAQRIRDAKKGDNNPMHGWERSEEHRQRSSISIKKAKEHIRETDAYKQRRLDTDNKRSQRNIYEYVEWRREVFKRDNYTCQKTGIKGGKLQAHHIFPFSNNEDLRFAVCNGLTLSKEAHREFHRKYGTKNNTLYQLEEWLGFKLSHTSQWMLEILSADDAYDYYQNMSDYDENGNYYWDNTPPDNEYDSVKIFRKYADYTV